MLFSTEDPFKLLGASKTIKFFANVCSSPSRIFYLGGQWRCRSLWNSKISRSHLTFHQRDCPWERQYVLTPERWLITAPLILLWRIKCAVRPIIRKMERLLQPDTESLWYWPTDIGRVTVKDFTVHLLLMCKHAWETFGLSTSYDYTVTSSKYSSLSKRLTVKYQSGSVSEWINRKNLSIFLIIGRKAHFMLFSPPQEN